MYSKVKIINHNQQKIHKEKQEKKLENIKNTKKINHTNNHITTNNIKVKQNTVTSNVNNGDKTTNLTYNSNKRIKSIENKALLYNDNTELVTIDTASPINLTSDKNLLVEFKTINGVNNYHGVGNSVINITGSGYLPIIESKDSIKYLYTYYTPEEEDLILSAYQLKDTCGYHFNENFSQLKKFHEFYTCQGCG